MWFKNLKLYHLENKFSYNPEELNKLFDAYAFRKCEGQELTHAGWTDIFGNRDDNVEHTYCHNIGNDWFFRFKKESKMIPASVITDEVIERIDEIESTQARTVRRKERNDIKADVLTGLIPKAFPLHKEVGLWINAEEGIVGVETSSAKVADEVTSLMRNTLDTFPIKPFTFKDSISDCLTKWLEKGDAPSLLIGDETELKGDNGIIRAKKQDLTADEIKVHIEAGKLVTSLALSIPDDVSFIVDEDFNIKRIKLSDTITDNEKDKQVSDDPAAMLDADMSLMAGEYRKLIDTLSLAFGGTDF